MRAGNPGPFSNASSATTHAPDTTPPSAPGHLTSSAASRSRRIDSAGGAATDNVGVTGYRVERCTGAGCTTFAQIATPTGTSFSDTGLTASTSYSYRVRAVDAAGNLGRVLDDRQRDDGGATRRRRGRRRAADIERRLGDADRSRLGRGDGRRRRDGLPSRALRGSGCTTFAQIATPTGTTFNDTGLTASTTYSYRVRAVDAAGNPGAFSATSTATTRGRTRRRRGRRPG